MCISLCAIPCLYFTYDTYSGCSAHRRWGSMKSLDACCLQRGKREEKKEESVLISFSVYCSCPAYRCLLYVMLSDLNPFLSCPCNENPSSPQMSQTNKQTPLNTIRTQRPSKEIATNVHPPTSRTTSAQERSPNPHTPNFNPQNHSHNGTTPTPRSPPPPTSDTSTNTHLPTLLIRMHHLRLSCSSSPTPATSAIRPHLLLCDHELRPLTLQPPCSSKIASQNSLRVLFDGRLVSVEALQLDDLGRIGVFAHDANAWRSGAQDSDLFCRRGWGGEGGV